MGRPAARTLEELKQMTSATIRPVDAAGVLGCVPYLLNVAAREGKLAVNHYFSGSRLHISRLDFIRWVEGGGGIPVIDPMQLHELHRMMMQMQRTIEELRNKEAAR